MCKKNQKEENLPIKKTKNEEKFYQKYKVQHYLGHIDDAFIETLCEMVIEFGQTSDGSHGYVHFMRRLGIPWMTFHDWMDKYPNLKQAYIEGKLLIAETRIRQGLLRKFEPTLVKFTVGHYDPTYKDADEQDNARVKVVVLENYGDTGRTAIEQRDKDKA